ncbi:MAG: PLDc N-terminal domain-containing protein [Candidatus Dormiibacterota bacterium]
MITMLAIASATLVAALVPLLVVVVGFDVFCLVDIARAKRAAYLPRWAWAILCVTISPLAGIVYLAVGKPR